MTSAQRSLDLDNLMDFARRSVDGAGKLVLSHFGVATVAYKSDGSELTAADTAGEAFLQAAIAERFPDHGIFGEEGTRVDSRSSSRWIIDPIDGTRSFAAGVPLFGILLTLEVDGEPLLGCSHFPALGYTVTAAVGAGCWVNDQRAKVSDCERLEEARVITSGLEYWRDWATPVARDGLENLLGSVRYLRTWGDCYGYCQVAMGRAEILADPAVGALWDYAPMVPIMTEAGGRLTTLSGGPISSWSSALATNARLHSSATAFWKGAADLALQTDALRVRAAGSH